jgi:hypothetical protein
MQSELRVSLYLSHAFDTARSTLTWLRSNRPLRRTHFILLSFRLLFDRTRLSHAPGPCKIFLWRKTIRTRAFRRNSGRLACRLIPGKKAFNARPQRTQRKKTEPGSPVICNLSPVPSFYFSRIRERNSSRVCAFSRNEPSMALVTVCEFCFSTPRITMHRWRAWTTTPTPSGEMFC